MGTVSITEVGIYTVADLHAYREQRDDLTVQLLDGELVVTPSPGVLHQVVHSSLFQILAECAPGHLRVVSAPLDLRAGERTVLQPDLMVIDREVRAGNELVTAPVLVVEILSPSTRRTDLVAKPEVLAALGCEHYWVVDPEHPALRVFRRGDGGYRTERVVEGDSPVEIEEPFRVRFRPTDLLR